MSTDDLWNGVKRIVEALLSTVPTPRRGTMESIDPGKMRAKITFQPEGGLSGWLPIATLCSGPGWGILAVPPQGAQVVALPTDGYAGAAVVMGSHWDDGQLPPTGYNPGEIWLFHQSGAFIKVLNSGQILVRDKAGATLTADGTGAFKCQDKAGAFVQANGAGIITLQDSGATASITLDNSGKGTVTGNLQVNGYIHSTGDVVAGGISLEGHVHSGVTTGTSDTGPPV